MIKKLILIFALMPSVVFAASIINDFDAGYPISDVVGDIHHVGILNNSTNVGYENDRGGVWVYETDRTHGDDPQVPYLQTTNCVDGNCMRVDVNTSTTSCDSTGNPGNFYVYVYSAFNSKPIFDQAADADRVSMYVAIPPEYPESNYYTMHVGTYTKNPSVADVESGPHFYHWFGLIGSNYYSKIICNQHPQNEVGGEYDPGTNPYEWDYIQNLYRFYLDASFCSPIGEYSAYFDEIKFEDIAPAVDDAENVASIACSYIGDGEYRITWFRNTHSTTYSGHIYSVRWSNNPITAANYSSATLISDTIGRSPDANVTTDAFEANFTIAKTSGTVYFGIYDETADNGLVTAFDFIIAEAPYLSSPTYDNPTITGPDDFSTTNASVEIDGSYTIDPGLSDQSAIVTWTLGESSGFCVAALGVFSCTVPVELGVNSVVFTVTDSNSGTANDSITVTRVKRTSKINGSATIKNATIH